MPTIFILRNLRIRIYPKDHNPPHVHVIGPDVEAKFSICTLECIENYGFSERDLNRIIKYLENKIDILLEAWEEYHEE